MASLHYLIHWPYNFVSGPLADITLVTAFATTLFLPTETQLSRPPLLALTVAPPTTATWSARNTTRNMLVRGSLWNGSQANSAIPTCGS